MKVVQYFEAERELAGNQEGFVGFMTDGQIRYSIDIRGRLTRKALFFNTSYADKTLAMSSSFGTLKRVMRLTKVWAIALSYRKLDRVVGRYVQEGSKNL